jgi:hypothetical protein
MQPPLSEKLIGAVLDMVLPQHFSSTPAACTSAEEQLVQGTTASATFEAPTATARMATGMPLSPVATLKPEDAVHILEHLLFRAALQQAQRAQHTRQIEADAPEASPTDMYVVTSPRLVHRFLALGGGVRPPSRPETSSPATQSALDAVSGTTGVEQLALSEGNLHGGAATEQVRHHWHVHSCCVLLVLLLSPAALAVLFPAKVSGPVTTLELLLRLLMSQFRCTASAGALRIDGQAGRASGGAVDAVAATLPRSVGSHSLSQCARCRHFAHSRRHSVSTLALCVTSWAHSRDSTHMHLCSESAWLTPCNYVACERDLRQSTTARSWSQTTPPQRRVQALSSHRNSRLGHHIALAAYCSPQAHLPPKRPWHQHCVRMGTLCTRHCQVHRPKKGTIFWLCAGARRARAP